MDPIVYETKPKPNRHIFGIVVFIIIVILLFTTNIKSFINSSKFQDNLTYAQQKIEMVWNDYIFKSIKYIWNDILFGDLLKVKPETFDKAFNIKDVTDKMSGGQ
jgi:hypothetical protein